MYMRGILDQMCIDGFNSPFGFPINEENRWVKLMKTIPWEELENLYAKKFEKEGRHNTGNVAIPFRIALGSLIIKKVMGLSDRGTVKAIQENPYLQYFLGLPRYSSEAPFDPSMMVHFRKRLSLDEMKEINDEIVRFQKKTTIGRHEEKRPERQPSLSEPDARCAAECGKGQDTRAQQEKTEGMAAAVRNMGTLIIDATCCPVHIRYPQDFSLLNEAREKLDKLIGILCKELGRKKPRTYCRKAEKVYLNFAKTKKRPLEKIRKVIKYMLSCVRRNLGYVDSMLQDCAIISPYWSSQLETIRILYGQQKEMYDKKTNRVPNRIVSLHMPFIRPIMRGKVPNPTEFGPKVDMSVDGEGNTFLETFSFDAYNESTHLIKAIESYHERNGCYPERVLADAIYRNSDNLRYCKEKGIRLSGPKLGRPPADPEKTKAAEKVERQDMKDRTEVERTFSREKRCFGLGEVFEKLEETVKSTISLGPLLDNLIPVGF